MKTLVIVIAVLFATPALARAFNVAGPQSERERANNKCFSSAPWVVPSGYYADCLAAVPK